MDTTLTDFENKGLSIFSGSVEDDNLDEIMAGLAAEIKRTNAKRLVIDSLSAFQSKYKNDIYIIAKRLVSLIQEHHLTAIITIFTTQKSGFEISSLNLSPLFQNIILLRICGDRRTHEESFSNTKDATDAT